MTLLSNLNSRAVKIFSRVPLQTVLVVSFIAQVSIAVGVTGWLSFRSGQQAVNDVAAQLRNESTARIKEKLTSYLDSPHLVNELNASTIELGYLNIRDMKGLERHFWQQMQQFPSISYISLGNEAGEYIGVERINKQTLHVEVADKSTGFSFHTYATDRNGQRTTLLQSIPNYDPRKRDWYKTAVQAGGASTWTSIYTYFSTAKLTITADRALYGKQGNLIGVTAADLVLSQISDFLRELKIGKSGQTFIVERSGLLVASSTPELPFTVSRDRPKQERLNALQSQDRLTSQTVNYLLQSFGSLDKIQGQHQLDFLTSDGQRQFLQVVPLKDNKGIDWLIVVVVPESDFMEQVEANNRSTGVLCVLALLMAIFSGMVTAKWLAKPVLELSAAAANLAKGEWQQSLPENHSAAEFDILSTAFSQMREQLRTSFITLKQRQDSLAEAQKIAHIGSWELDLTTGAMVWSDELFQILGVSPTSLTQPSYEDYLQLVHTDDVILVHQTIEQAIDKGIAYELDYRIVCPEGTVRQVYAKGKPIFSNREQFEPSVNSSPPPSSSHLHLSLPTSSSLTKIMGTVLDITERKCIEEALQVAKNNLQVVLGAVPGIVAWISVDLHYLGVNDHLAATFDLLPENFVYQKINFLDQSYQFGEELTNFMQSFFASKDLEATQEINAHFQGNLTSYLVVAQKYNHGEAAFVVGVDITQRKQAEEALRRAEAKYRNIFENAVEGIFQSTLEGRYISVNPALARIYGYDSPEELIAGITDIENQLYVNPESRREFVNLLATDHTITSFEAQVYRKDGTIIWISEHARLVKDTLNGQPYYEGIIEDITERKRAEEMIRYQALHDMLTNLPNRNLFNEYLITAIASAQKVKGMLAVMFLDLDRFKTINDSLGHTAGDYLLKCVVQRLTTCLDSRIIMARWGGDEFTLLVPQIRYVEDAIDIAQIILNALKPAFHIDEHTVHTSSSIGIAIYPYDGEDGVTLIKNADAALYYAKEQGRNNCQLYTKTMNCHATSLLALESGLHQALADGELLLYYQPKVNVNTWKITGIEALVRWQHPEKGLVSPQVFIPLAEESGLIGPLAEWVLRQACAQNKAWQDAGFPPLRMAVNLSARQFLQPSLVGLVSQVLAETKLEPQFLELEITETVAMQDAELTRMILHDLYDMGIHIAVDDFGTGYSSLNYLKNFPVHTVKIDQSFVRDLTVDPYDKAIIAAIVALAHGLGLNVVVEGVENHEQLHYLRSLRCEEIQGHLFSPPLLGEDITELLIQRSQANADFFSWVGI